MILKGLTPKVKKLIFIASLLVLQILATYFFLRFIALEDAKQSLNELHGRISHDLQIKNGQWDTTLYNADPHTPHPSGSNGFTAPLYIITSEGFVIERNQPISGLLDSSDFKHLNAFQTPETLAIVTNDQWRVLSRPILGKNNKVLGVTSVAYHNPNSNILVEIDETLEESLQKINSSVKIDDDRIDVSGVDIRTIRYDIAFEIVTSYNRVLLQNGRTPTFIDPSYIDNELKNKVVRVVRDAGTDEQFLVSMQPIKDANGSPQGVVLVGRSLHAMNKTLVAYTIFSSLIGLFVWLPFFVWISLKKYQPSSEVFEKSENYPKSVMFDVKESVIKTDKMDITIPYSTNQYYLCKAVFSHPKKRWELDELLKKFGESESPEGWRKVYDAAIIINKKVGFKLIAYSDKTFRLNPAIKLSK